MPPSLIDDGDCTANLLGQVSESSCNAAYYSDPSPGAPASQSTGTPNAEGSWQEENASSQEAIGNYKGDASTTSSSEWTQYRNQMGSKRWGTANGQNPAADSLYDPHGNDWYVCGIYGSGVSSYASFGIYCICYGPAIHPNGRPYFSRYGRYLGPKSPWRVRLLNPHDINAYNRAGNDPINNVGSDTGNPTNPPRPDSGMHPCFGGDVICDSMGNVVHVNGNIEPDNATNMAMAGAAYTAWDVTEMEAGNLFGTRFQGNNPLLNNNAYLRIGWSYIRDEGDYGFRVAGKALDLVTGVARSHWWIWGGPK